MLGQDDQETDTKNQALTNSDSELRNPFEMVKKPIQAFESLNSDIRARSQAKITILAQDENETEAKIRTSTNLASQLTNPFEMVKKTFQAFESLNFEVRARSQSQIIILSQDQKDIDAKNWAARNSAYEITNPLELVNKTCHALESLNSDIRDRSYAEITMLGQDDHEKDTKNRTLTNSDSELTKPLEMVKKTIQAIESLNSDIRVRSQA